MQEFGLRVIKLTSSEAELRPHFFDSKIGLVVDLHLLLGLDLTPDSCFVILESEFCLHAGA